MRCLEIAVLRTFFYQNVFYSQDGVLANYLMTGRQKAKPFVSVNLPVAKYTGKPYRLILQPGQNLRRTFQRIVVVYFPQPCVMSQSSLNPRSLNVRGNEHKIRDLHILVRLNRQDRQAGP